MAEIIISDANYTQFLDGTFHAGETRRCGTRPRDYSAYPHGCFAFAPAWNLPIIPEGERQARLDMQIAAKAQLSNIRDIGNNGQPVPAVDQGQRGYCWAHSGVNAHRAWRAKMGLPFADLSAYAVACIIKNYADEGGWGSEGIEFQSTRGVPTSEFWPTKSVSRSNDNPKTWDNAALHKMPVWTELDPKNMKAQLITALLLGFPVVADHSWWSHSICHLDVVSLSPFRIRFINSWSDSWGTNGTGILEESKAIPDSAWAIGLITPSTV